MQGMESTSGNSLPSTAMPGLLGADRLSSLGPILRGRTRRRAIGEVDRRGVGPGSDADGALGLPSLEFVKELSA